MLYSFYRRLSQLGGISTSRSVARPSSIFKNKLMQELYVNLAMVKDGCYAIFVKDKRRMWKQKTIGSTGVVHLAELLDTSCVPSAKFSNALPFQITVMVKTLTFKYQGADCLGVAAAGHLTTVDMSFSWTICIHVLILLSFVFFLQHDSLLWETKSCKLHKR